MSTGSIKTINVLSYILNVVLVLALIFVIRGTGNTPNAQKDANLFDNIKRVIVQQERAQLPMTVQKLSDVNDVKIDSLVLTNNVEPYQGYMVTQWDYKNVYGKKLKKQVLVEVTNITCTKEKVSWNSNWLGASLSLY